MDDEETPAPLPETKTRSSVASKMIGIMLIALLVSTGVLWVFGLGWFAAKLVAQLLGF